MPNYKVEIKRLEVELETHKLNLLKNELRVMDLQAEIDKTVNNDEATKEAIELITEKLKGLKEAHKGSD